MKQLVGIIAFLLVIGAGGFYALKNYFPNLIPPSKDIKQFLPASGDTGSPIRFSSINKLDAFADLKGELPRVLVFDNSGILFASLTNVGKVVALPDINNDLKADSVIEVLKGLNKPHGLAFNNGYLYVAETDKVSRYLYNSQTRQAGGREVLFNLPGGGRHFTRTIKIRDSKLYTSVGSSCDVCVEKDPYRASILVSNLDGTDLKVFAKGLRNTVFFDFDSQGKMWGSDMGRDNLGDNLPPDEVNIIEEGKDYGWPYCYGNRIKDMKFNKDSKITCSQTEPAVYELPAHNAPLGTIFDNEGNLLIALHGSWNSSVPVGYKIVKLSVFAGGVSGMTDYVSGFLDGKEVLARPAGLLSGSDGKLFISDDKGGLIYVLYK